MQLISSLKISQEEFDHVTWLLEQHGDLDNFRYILSDEVDGRIHKDNSFLDLVFLKPLAEGDGQDIWAQGWSRDVDAVFKAVYKYQKHQHIAANLLSFQMTVNSRVAGLVNDGKLEYLNV